jgi:hypothetical protein
MEVHGVGFGRYSNRRRREVCSSRNPLARTGRGKGLYIGRSIEGPFWEKWEVSSSMTLQIKQTDMILPYLDECDWYKWATGDNFENLYIAVRPSGSG